METGVIMVTCNKDATEKILKILEKTPGIISAKEFAKEPRIKLHCFGNFEIYIDGRTPKFKYVKTKELLAYLTDRKGSFCTNGELLGALWEDREVTSSLENYLRNLISDLKAVFRGHALDEFVIKQRGQLRINTKMADCDYYNWLKGYRDADNTFAGEYMTQYSWAETTLAGLENS